MQRTKAMPHQEDRRGDAEAARAPPSLLGSHWGPLTVPICWCLWLSPPLTYGGLKSWGVNNCLLYPLAIDQRQSGQRPPPPFTCFVAGISLPCGVCTGTYIFHCHQAPVSPIILSENRPSTVFFCPILHPAVSHPPSLRSFLQSPLS